MFLSFLLSISEAFFYASFSAYFCSLGNYLHLPFFTFCPFSALSSYFIVSFSLIAVSFSLITVIFYIYLSSLSFPLSLSVTYSMYHLFLSHWSNIFHLPLPFFSLSLSLTDSLSPLSLSSPVWIIWFVCNDPKLSSSRHEGFAPLKRNQNDFEPFQNCSVKTKKKSWWSSFTNN